MVEKMTLGLGATDWGSVILLMFFAVFFMLSVGVDFDLEVEFGQKLLFGLGFLVFAVTVFGIFSSTILTKKVVVTENKYQVVQTKGTLVSDNFNILLKNKNGSLSRKKVDVNTVKIKEGTNFSYVERIKETTYKASSGFVAFYKKVPFDKKARSVTLTVPQGFLEK